MRTLLRCGAVSLPFLFAGGRANRNHVWNGRGDGDRPYGRGFAGGYGEHPEPGEPVRAHREDG